MEFDKFKSMKPMKYVGGAAARKRVQGFLEDPMTYDGWVYSLKVDGEWSRIIHDLDGNVLIQGRGISRVTGKHTEQTEKVPHIVEEVKKYVPRGTVLIGEMAFGDIDTNQREVGSVFRSLVPRALKLQEKRKLVFYTFDALAFDGLDLSNEVLGHRYDKVVSNLVETDYIKRVRYHRVDENTLEVLDEILENGGEGIMLMNPAGKYLPGSRSVTVSLKIKKELGEITVPVTGIVDPIREYRGDNPHWEYEEDGEKVTKYHALGWKAGVEFDYKGTKVKVVSGISDEDAKWLSTEAAANMIKNGELKAEITAMEEVVVEGVPNLRHPVLLKLRTDLGGE